MREVARAVQTLWGYIRKDYPLRKGEHLEVDVLDGPMLEATADELRIGMDFFHVDRARETYRRWTIAIPGQALKAHMQLRSRMVDLITEHLRYLAAVVLPFRAPKGWRLYSRRLHR